MRALKDVTYRGRLYRSGEEFTCDAATAAAWRYQKKAVPGAGSATIAAESGHDTSEPVPAEPPPADLPSPAPGRRRAEGRYQRTDLRPEE